MSNSLGPDQDQCSVCPDLGPNCLHRLSADDKQQVATSKERVKKAQLCQPLNFAADLRNQIDN